MNNSMTLLGKKYPDKVEDMNEKQVRELEELLRPGKDSVGGFLGKDENLREVIQADEETLKKHRLAPKQIHDRILSITKLALQTIKDEAGDDIEKFYEIRKKGVTLY